jgi:hypothetical protein
MTAVLADMAPLTRTATEPGTFTLRCSVSLSAATASVAALDADTQTPDSTTVWKVATWDGPQTVAEVNGITWYTRSLTILFAGDLAPVRADQITLGPGEWSTWVAIEDPPTRLERRFDVITVLA